MLKLIRNGFLLLLALMILGVILWFTLGQRLAARYVISRIGPGSTQEYHAWRTDPIHLPSEALTPLKFSSETEALATKLRDMWDNDAQLRDLALKITIQWSGDIETGVPPALLGPRYGPPKEDMERLRPFIEAFEAVIDQDDFEMNAFAAAGDTYMPFFTPSLNFLMAQVCAKLLGLKALSFANSGDFVAAFQTTRKMLRSTKISGYSELIPHLISMGNLWITVDTWDYLIQNCNDVDQIREEFEDLRNLPSRNERLPLGIPPFVIQHIAALRFAKGQGRNVRIDGLTGEEIFREIYRAEVDHLETVVLPRHSGDLEKQREIRSKIQRAKAYGDILRTSFPRLAALVGGQLALASRYTFFLHSDVDFRETESEVAFDLLRLRTALRLYTLEIGAPPQSLSDLIPTHFDKLPIDGFDSENRTYRLRSVLYSVGFDGVDNGLSVIYDPTNGTKSDGDIIARREALELKWSGRLP